MQNRCVGYVSHEQTNNSLCFDVYARTAWETDRCPWSEWENWILTLDNSVRATAVKWVCCRGWGGGGLWGSMCQVPSKSMQGRVFFLVVALQTGSRAVPVHLLFYLIIQIGGWDTEVQPVIERTSLIKHVMLRSHVWIIRYRSIQKTYDTVSMLAFLVVIQCRYQRFERTYCLHLQDFTVRTSNIMQIWT